MVGSNGGTPETRAMVDQADVIVFVGCRAGSVTTERWRHPAPGKVRVVHIDVDPAVIGVNYPTEVAVVGDARLALAALREEVARSSKRPARAIGRERVARAKAEKFATFQEVARSDETPIRPERIVATLQELLPRDALVVADRRHAVPVLLRLLRVPQRRPAFHHQPGPRCARLCAAGRHRCADRPAAARCVAIMGDGSFGFASGELETIARLGLPIAMVVIANATFGWIKAGQKSGFAERYFSVDFTPGQHARIAEAYGIRAWRVEDPADLRPALAARRSRAAGRPWSTSSPSPCTRRGHRSRSGWHDPSRVARGGKAVTGGRSDPDVSAAT